jgi:hydrogenase-4 component E
VVIVPAVVLRLLRDARVDVATSHRLGVATMVLIAIAVSVIGFFVVGSLHIRSSSLPSTTLGTAAAVVLVAFLLVILRSDVVSQAVGFFALENGVSLAALALAPGLPLMVETAFLFDLLVAVVVIGILMRVHHGRTQTLSTDVIERLRG